MGIAEGTRIGPYTFQRELGRGGMGTVYLAEDSRLGNRCAIKVLHEHLTHDETTLTRFQNEVRAASSIQHPCIVKVRPIERLDSGPWCYVMEYVDGPTLTEFCRRRREPIPPRLILEIVGPICVAFDLLHMVPIVHRDLKPDNVLIVQQGGSVYPRVLDFGIAKRLGEPGPTRPGLAPGTVAFMAPEQAIGGAVDRTCDVYSLGVMIYWMATGGHLPYEVSDAVMYFAQVNEPPIDPRRRCSEISETLASVILTAIHADPVRRPRSMGALALMLSRCVPDGADVLRAHAPELLRVGNLDETYRAPSARRNAPTARRYDYGPALGKGGMAEVVRATLRGAGHFAGPRAIKLILPEFAQSPEFVQMFHDEARIASLLQHRNIVRVLEHDEDELGRLYLAMELVDGIDLNKLWLSGPIPHGVTIWILCEVLEALDYIHELPPSSPLASPDEIAARGNVRGLVHRDVSHHNVLLSWLLDVKLSDFGIAKTRSATAAVGSKLIKGKVGYMSPEQASAADRLDGRSDLWAIGVMLWELLTGQVLFPVSDNFAATLYAVVFSEIARPCTVRPGIPPDLDLITMRLLERDLSRRFQSAREVIDALRACTSAPRDGRAELGRLLAERFPERARPVPTVPAPRPTAPTTVAIAPRASAPPSSSASGPPPSSSASGTAPANSASQEHASPASAGVAFAVSSPSTPAAPWGSTTTGHTAGQTQPIAGRSSRWVLLIATVALSLAVVVAIAASMRVHDASAVSERSIPEPSAATRATPGPSASSAPPAAVPVAAGSAAPATLSPAVGSGPVPASPTAGSAAPVAPTAFATLTTVMISTTPPDARVHVGGIERPVTAAGSRLMIQVPIGTQLHIRAERDGFHPLNQDLTVDQQHQSVTLTLVPRTPTAIRTPDAKPTAPARPPRVRRPEILE